DLGGIFLAEKGEVRLDDVEQLCDHCGHATKMSRPRPPAQALAQPFHDDPGNGSGRIHFLNRWSEYQVNFFPLQHRAVALERARILGEVFGRPKLRGVYEDGNRYYISFGASRPDQRKVSFMERTHE